MAINAVVIIVLFVFGLCLSCEDCGSSSNDKWNIKDTVFVISTLICIISMVLFIAGVIILGNQEWKISDEPYRTEYIASLNDGTQINGRFYLRHGYIEENMYYQYMVKRSDGGYSYGKAREDIATIYISDGNYRVEWYKMERHWLWFNDEKSICKIYVPEGCIKEEYSIDLE